MSKYLLTIVIPFLFLGHTTLSAAKINPEIKKTFDGEKGWWWYEEEVKDPKTDEINIVTYKVSPADKLRIERQEKTNKLLQMIVIEQKENKELNKKVLKRLNYAFPNTTPIYTKNSKTGEKCLTNSSAECFVMPVIAEGQHVPVLKDFLRNPSPKNSKKWLQFQAKYFNHVNKVSHGLRFAFLKDGSDAYPIMTDYVYGDNLFNATSENMRVGREEKIIKNLKNELAYLIFLGESKVYERTTGVYENLFTTNKRFLKDMNKIFVLPSEKVRRQMDQYIVKELYEKQGKKGIYTAWKEAKIVVRPDLYNKYNIRITPTVVAFYKKEKMEKGLTQIISIGGMDLNSMRIRTIDFLEYNGIVESKERAADKNWNQLDDDAINKSLQEIPKGKTPTDFDKIKKINDEDN